MNTDSLKRFVAAQASGKRAADERIRAGRDLFKKIRVAAGLSQAALASRFALPEGKSSLDKIRRWERGECWPNPEALNQYANLSREVLKSPNPSEQDHEKFAEAVLLLRDFVEIPDFEGVDLPEMTERGSIPGRLDLRLPLPKTDFEEHDLGEDGSVLIPVRWYESSPPRVHSGGVFVGEFTECLRIGKLTISVDESGLNLQFPPNWKVEGLSDRWAAHRAYIGPSRRRRVRGSACPEEEGLTETGGLGDAPEETVDDV